MKQFIRNCDSGFTLIELLVASLLGSIVIGLALSSSLVVRNVYQQDLVRTRITENVRGAMNIIGTTVREAGENLPSTFNAVEFVPGTGSNPDELILRRNLKDEVLKVCEDIAAASSGAEIYFAKAAGPQGCSRTDNLYNLTQWQTYRTEEGGTVRAYIYDHAASVGEFFDYVDENDDGNDLVIERSSGSWTNAYPTASSAVYILEEWHFKLIDDPLSDTQILQVIENRETADAMNVMFGISDMQIQAVMTDDTKVPQLATGETWVDLKAVEVEMTGLDYDRDSSVVFRTMTSQFFPRNILSN